MEENKRLIGREILPRALFVRDTLSNLFPVGNTKFDKSRTVSTLLRLKKFAEASKIVEITKIEYVVLVHLQGVVVR